ncbi:MAG: hypothetical protein QG584_459, partial [Pseudomonadota bacterium]|nr:hypothetical protein [Pseudomonadota bacterium]
MRQAVWDSLIKSKSVIPAKAGIQKFNKLDTGSGKARPGLSLAKGRCDGLNQRFPGGF